MVQKLPTSSTSKAHCWPFSRTKVGGEINWINSRPFYMHKKSSQRKGSLCSVVTVHWSEGSLVRISQWPYGVYIWKDVQCFLIPKVKHHFRVRDGVRVRVRVRVRACHPSDQWTFGLVTSNLTMLSHPLAAVSEPKRSSSWLFCQLSV